MKGKRLLAKQANASGLNPDAPSKERVGSIPAEPTNFMNTKNVPLLTLLESLTKSRFYGTLELKFEAGNIVLCRKTQTIKFSPEDNYGA